MRIGIDLGGTKTEAMLMGPDGADLMRLREETPTGDYAATLALIGQLVSTLDSEAGTPCPVGIGMPGAISPATGVVKNANSTWLIGQPFLHHLEEKLGTRVRLANDADCFALSEATDGAGRGAASVFGIILGTGVGGGLVVNGRLVSGPNAISGEWGHNPLPWPQAHELPGPQCYCGKHGCIESWCSGPGLSADHLRVTRHKLKPENILLAAQTGNPEAKATLDRYADRLARSLASVVNVVDPHAIVLGGGLSHLDYLYDAVPALLPQYVFSDNVVTPVRRNLHGASSGIRGAAWLWPSPANGGH
jgi:fructokinase